MPPEFNGIERRLDELNERLARLYPFQDKAQDDFLGGSLSPRYRRA